MLLFLLSHLLRLRGTNEMEKCFFTGCSNIMVLSLLSDLFSFIGLLSSYDFK